MVQLPQPDPRFLKALRSLEEAVECQRDGRTDEAERLFSRLLKKNPDYFDALHFFGLFRYQQGQLGEALKLLTKATKVHPRSADAHNNLGVVLDALKRSRDAIAAYDRALALNPDHPGRMATAATRSACSTGTRMPSPATIGPWRWRHSTSRPSPTAAPPCWRSSATRRRSRATTGRWR